VSCGFVQAVARAGVAQLQVIDAVCYIAVTHPDQVFPRLEKNPCMEQSAGCSLAIKSLFYLLCRRTETGVLAACIALICLNDA